MTIIEFVALSAANLALIICIIRWRGVASAEGLCMAYLGMAVATDNTALICQFLTSPGSLTLGHREFAFRLYPTSVEIFGLFILMAGLQAASGRPKQIARQLCNAELQQLRSIGLAITAVGLITAVAALYLAGGLSSSGFYGGLNLFRSQALPFGGFWYRGADIAVFGLALTLPSCKGRTKRTLLILALMMCIAFFLRTNKGGLEEPFIWGTLVLLVYNRPFLKQLVSFKAAALAIIIAFLGIGAKFLILPRALRDESPPRHFTQLIKTGTAAIALRWGDNGLYRGYCQFVNMLPDNRGLFEGSKVGVYSLTSWVPRFLYHTKPDHPFRGIGFMIYSDFHTFPDETPAPMLVGSAMADHGFLSIIVYLFLSGMFLGFLRQFAMATSKSLYTHCSYMFFALFGGFSAEEGTLGILYTLLLAFAVVAAARLCLFALDLLRLPPSLRASSGAAVQCNHLTIKS